MNKQYLHNHKTIFVCNFSTGFQSMLPMRKLEILSIFVRFGVFAFDFSIKLI